MVKPLATALNKATQLVDLAEQAHRGKSFITLTYYLGSLQGMVDTIALFMEDEYKPVFKYVTRKCDELETKRVLLKLELERSHD